MLSDYATFLKVPLKQGWESDIDKKITEVDANNDGKLTLEEIEKFMTTKEGSSVHSIKDIITSLVASK